MKQYREVIERMGQTGYVRPTAKDIEDVRNRLRADPDLNLYMLAFDIPELEAAALHVARELDSQDYGF